MVALSREEAHILVQITLLQQTKSSQLAPTDDNHPSDHMSVIVEELTIGGVVSKVFIISCRSGRVPRSGIRTCFTQLEKRRVDGSEGTGSGK